MAVKAKAEITIFYVAEVEAVYRYYLLQSSTLAKPSVPTSYPPSSSWVVTEPTYTEGSTNSLYYVDCTILTDGTWSYSPVSLSSSYEAAKLAYNKALAAEGRVTEVEADIEVMNGQISLKASKTEVTTAINEIEIGGRNLILDSAIERGGSDYLIYTYSVSEPMVEGDVYTISMCVTPAEGVSCYLPFVSSGYAAPFGQMYVSGTNKQILSKTITGDWTYYEDRTPEDNILHGDVRIYRLPNDDTVTGESTIHWIKLEKGNKATDWTPAPEDQQAAIDIAAGNLNASIGDIQASLDVTNSTMSDLQSEQDTTYKIVTEHETQISQLLQTADGWTMSFETLNTTVTELNDQLTTEVNERYEYIRFVDGDIYLGKRPEAGEDDLQLIISNDKISFNLNGTEVAYFSDDALYVTTIHVTRSLRFGNFEFAERSNGNMGLRWVGES